MGFEPGTFRSCVEHSNHYTTEARPIPDVLIAVLVAPKCSVVTLACMRHNRTTIEVFPTPRATVHDHLPYLHPSAHCSPKFGLYRFFQKNSSKSLSFNMADLGRILLLLLTTCNIQTGHQHTTTYKIEIYIQVIV